MPPPFTIPEKMFYTFTASPRGSSVTMLRGEGAPKTVSGGARWNVIERPRRKSVITWAGDDPYRMDVPIMFDGWADDRRESVEDDIAVLNQMWQAPPEGMVPPQFVTIEGAVPIKGAKWVIESIDWGDQVIWAAEHEGKGYRLRQDAVVHFLQFVTEQLLTRKDRTAGTRPYKVKKGDTLRKIAAKFHVTVAQIKAANGKVLRDPKKLKPGMTIKIPKPVPGPTYVSPVTGAVSGQGERTSV